MVGLWAGIIRREPLLTVFASNLIDFAEYLPVTTVFAKECNHRTESVTALKMRADFECMRYRGRLIPEERPPLTSHH